MKYKYEFEGNTFQKGDCTECPISYMVYNEDEELEHLCPVGSPRSCPLEETKGELTLTDFVDTTIVNVRSNMCDNYCKYTKECAAAIDRGEDYPCPLDKL